MKYQVLSSQRELLQFVEEDEKTVIITGDDRARIHRERELVPFIDAIEHIAIQTEMVCFIHDSCILIKK